MPNNEQQFIAGLTALSKKCGVWITKKGYLVLDDTDRPRIYCLHDAPLGRRISLLSAVDGPGVKGTVDAE